MGRRGCKTKRYRDEKDGAGRLSCFGWRVGKEVWARSGWVEKTEGDGEGGWRPEKAKDGDGSW